MTWNQNLKAESVTFLVSLIIVASLVGLVIHSQMTQSDRPPIVEITPNGSIEKINGKFYVPFTVTNRGGETAESVQVIGEIENRGVVEESGEQIIDFLAPGEKEKGAFIFIKDPVKGGLSLRVAGYKLP